MHITALHQLDPTATYSYADYLTWQFEQLAELLRGRFMPMSAPGRVHQHVSFILTGEFYNYFKNRQTACRVYTAPFDVRLVKNPQGKSDKEIYNVVQPDLCVICDEAKLDKRGCLGAPDLIVEIVSAHNAKRDVVDKYALYEENGVREYWIVRPHEKTVERFLLEDGRYTMKGYFTRSEHIASLVLPDLSINLSEVFAGIPDDEFS